MNLSYHLTWAFIEVFAVCVGGTKRNKKRKMNNSSISLILFLLAFIPSYSQACEKCEKKIRVNYEKIIEPKINAMLNSDDKERVIYDHIKTLRKTLATMKLTESQKRKANWAIANYKLAAMMSKNRSSKSKFEDTATVAYMAAVEFYITIAFECSE